LILLNIFAAVVIKDLCWGENGRLAWELGLSGSHLYYFIYRLVGLITKAI